MSSEPPKIENYPVGILWNTVCGLLQLEANLFFSQSTGKRAVGSPPGQGGFSMIGARLL